MAIKLPFMFIKCPFILETAEVEWAGVEAKGRHFQDAVGSAAEPYVVRVFWGLACPSSTHFCKVLLGTTVNGVGTKFSISVIHKGRRCRLHKGRRP